MAFIVFVNVSKMLISIAEDEKATITNSNSGEKKLYLYILADVIAAKYGINIAKQILEKLKKEG
ncbi:hypothetical protein [Clostridium beijerinckii]|uniref:Uncharacterized protein n=1 Tax=Clostridium beijerinckii TaxID=1520 RepID=A0A1S9N0G1_CLOBE|nr:hypothetical protein [Clostridium beijerinckii]MZK53132.1 hypothetical protein [Clostridium beijerinckii]MZK61230.1 hypothetical protein [Clostridium beijerinckii]MZK71429.1 hypothetical protein [Clostridium beijerinckii]MZK86496.1 hypothetical protein [Clostridium beijerinckii]MZL00808.1 hypothetical protein [Clostridium beijerinckii]